MKTILAIIIYHIEVEFYMGEATNYQTTECIFDLML